MEWRLMYVAIFMSAFIRIPIEKFIKINASEEISLIVHTVIAYIISLMLGFILLVLFDKIMFIVKGGEKYKILKARNIAEAVSKRLKELTGLDAFVKRSPYCDYDFIVYLKSGEYVNVEVYFDDSIFIRNVWIDDIEIEQQTIRFWYRFGKVRSESIKNNRR